MTHIEALRDKIRKANEAYWIKANPIISDQEYDKLMRELKKLSPEDPLLKEIGSEKKTGDEVVHKIPMLSLAKAYSYNEILDWCSKVARSEDEQYLVSCKYDGMSVAVCGDRLVSRGDGHVGHDITGIAPHCGMITQIEWNDEAERFTDNDYGLQALLDHAEDENDITRGELLVPIKRFNELKQKYPELFAIYKTPRNLAAGLVNSKPGSAIYELKDRDGFPLHIADVIDHSAYCVKVTLRDLKNKTHDFVKELRDFYGFPSDGICFFLADKKYFESLGYTAHHPRGAIAWKFVDEQAQSIVRHIEWQVGEEHVTPVVEFDVVPINGVLVKRATAHCAQWFKEHNICVGSRVTIERKGGVIPKVINVENDDPHAQAVLPTVCPECGQKLREEGKFLTCTNKDCIGRCVNKIVRGFRVLGLKGVGYSLVSRVVHEFMFRDIIDWCLEIGDWTKSNFDILRKKGFTDHEISLITSVHDIMLHGAPPEMLLQSVCIPNCGNEFITTIEKECGGIEHLIQIVPCDHMYDDIVSHCKINAVSSFMIWMEENKERFMMYMNLFKILPGMHMSTGLHGTRGIICFTGSGPHPRDVLAQYAIGHNYQVTDNANKCTILVAEDPNGNSTKLQKARAKGIKVINYSEFLNL